MSALEFSMNGDVARIVLNRPDKLNSFNFEMLDAFPKAIDQARRARVLVITGAGRAFCAGQDLENVPVPEVDLEAHLNRHYLPIVERLVEIPAVTIAAVNGVAAGAGANLAFMCDLVVASSRAKFIQPFAKLGIIPDAGGSWTIARSIGEARAMGMCLTAEPVSAETAERWGLIWRCIDEDKFTSEVEALLERVSKGATQGLAATRKAIRFGPGFEQHMAMEARVQGALG
ncbi:MAG: enoyl-CoA hydratase-related protein, partial [Myxococcota bacterium]